MTSSMEQRKSKMPEANKMARMIRSGRTTGDLAVRYGVNSNAIALQLTANGYDAITGAWLGRKVKKDYNNGGVALSARGDGAGQTCHHVGGGDNPGVVPTTVRPFTERPKPRGFAWPVNDTPLAVPPKPKLKPHAKADPWGRQKGNNARRKITPEQETELAKRYLAEESSVELAAAYHVNERTIRKYLHHLGVPLRTRAEAQRLRYQRDHAMVTIELSVPKKDVA